MNNSKESQVDMGEVELDNDEIVEQDYLSSLIEQEDVVIYYEIEGIYKSNKKDKKEYKSSRDLRKEPPVLVMKDNIGNEAQFELTVNLVRELIDTLSEVDRAYLGFSGPRDKNLPKGFFSKLVYKAKQSPMKAALASLPLLIIIYIALRGGM